MVRQGVLTAICLLASSAVACNDAGLATLVGGQRLAPGVDAEALNGIRIGMSECEVSALLGEPRSVTGVTALLREVMPAAYQGLDVRLVTWRYALPFAGARRYPMLWLHFRDGRLEEVYGKRYELWGFDEKGVFGISERGRWGDASSLTSRRDFPVHRR